MKSTRNLAAELTHQGHGVSAGTVGDLQCEEGFSLQAGTKTIEGKQHPDRDAQFRYINERAREYTGTGQPVISVDTKKGLVGDCKNASHQWRPPREPVLVKTHEGKNKQSAVKSMALTDAGGRLLYCSGSHSCPVVQDPVAGVKYVRPAY